jgi:hypothetical protein
MFCRLLFVNILAVSHMQVLPSEYQDYLKSMVGVQHDKTLKINTHKGLPCGNEGFIRKLSDKVGRDL